MKRFILFILLVFLPVLSFAGTSFIINSFSNFGEGGGCVTPDNGNELDEGFGNPTDNTWSNSGTTITVGADLPGTGPTGTWETCDKGVRFQADNSTPQKRYAFGSTIARTKNTTSTLILYINSASLTAYALNRLFALNNSTTPASNQLYNLALAYTTGTTYNLRAIAATTSSTINIAVGTYYKVTIFTDGAGAAAGSTLDVDSWNGSSWVDVGAQTFTRLDAYDVNYVHVGPYDGVGAGESLDMYVGLVSINAVTP